MISWILEKISSPKQNGLATPSFKKKATSSRNEDMAYSSYPLGQGIEVKELSMEEFLRVYKQK